MHARLPKNFVLEERIARYADAIEVRPASYAGRWAEACAPAGGAPFREVRLDLGCGKGGYIVEASQREPHTLFIGVDAEPVCVVYAAQAILEAGVRNALVIPGTADQLSELFAPGELAGITINFPTPQPQKKRAHQRVVTVDRLAAYRDVLAPDGTITLRTDSRPLFDYALPQFEGAGYRMLWTSHDTRGEHPEFPETEYELRLAQEGARVNGICAVPGNAPSPQQLQAARDMPQSLFDYLPDDLFDGAYVPHGMGYAITNFKNRRNNRAARTL